MKPFKIERSDYKVVGKTVPKKDSNRLLYGEPSYMDDFAPKDCLIIKLLRSKYPHAIIKNVDYSLALKVPGMVAVYTYKDVPNKRFTLAGQSYPEPSPYDRLILDQHVRYIGDPVAIVVGETDTAVDSAIKLIKVDYEILEPVLDFKTALNNKSIVHPEDDWYCSLNTGNHNANLIHHSEYSRGDVEKVFSECDVTLKRTYHTKANHQAYLETFRAYCEIDGYGRLHCVSSTQIVFHVRRIIANALGIEKNLVRCEKLRVGGGFGAKQTANCEVFSAFVTWKLKRPSKIIFTRNECLTCGCPRHEMEMTIEIGAMNDGTIRAIDFYTLSNGGSYGEHTIPTMGLSFNRSVPVYTANLEAARFKGDAVYTNVQASGAFRGFGATQGCFALESIVNELADKLKMNPAELRLKNLLREGMTMNEYFGQKANACALDKCILFCREKFGWNEKYPVRDMGNGKVRASGMAISMQGSSIANVDIGSCRISLIDDGKYFLTIGAADIGTGCDTVLAQMAAEVLECNVSDINVMGADTDISPYDSGSYASSTTYITGLAAANAANKLRENICKIGANQLGLSLDDVDFDGCKVYSLISEKSVTIKEISYLAQRNNNISVEITESCSSKVSPPPYIASMAEVEVDMQTGKVELLNFESILDCGIPVNPALARIQTEGGAVTGIGMALTENVIYNAEGKIITNNLLQYRLPTRADIGKLDADFAYSYEPSSAYGVKSAGEVTVNSAPPAIAHAVARATGHYFRELPITPEKVLRAINGMDYNEIDLRK